MTAGDNVRPRAGDVRAGELVLAAGTTLSPARLAAIAAAGVAVPSCAARARVTIVTTGTELRRPGEQLDAGEIYESNGVMLDALLTGVGALVERVDTVTDDPAEHAAALARGLAGDVLVTSGGVSVGPHDLVRDTVARLGVEEVFWGVAMRPGKPLSFGVRGATLVFGLPGNPVSSLVGALLFVLPAIRALHGVADPAPAFSSGVLAGPVKRGAHRDDYVRAASERSGDETLLRPIVGQESHMIVRSAAADALVHVPRGEGAIEAGAAVRYLPIGA